MKEIDTYELKRMIGNKEDFILLDCRGIDYFLWERLPGAINIRWKYIEGKAQERIPDKKTRIVT